MDLIAIAIASFAPLGAVVLAFGVGYCLDRIVLSALEKRFVSLAWQWEIGIVAAIRRVVVILCGVGGVAIAIQIAHAPPSVVGSLDKALLAIAIGAVTLTVGRLAADMVGTRGTAFTQAMGRNTARRTMSLLSTVAQVTVVILGALILLDSLGVTITPLLTALGVGGLAVALALQGVLSNIFSGLEIIASHHIRPGDYIKLDMGSEGYVMDINWRNTTIRDVTNTMIIVPNDKLASSVVWNYNLPRKDVYMLAIDVPVPRDSDLEQIERVSTDVARQIVSGLSRPDEQTPAPEPFVRFSAMTGDQVTVTTYVQARHYMDGTCVRHEFIKGFQRELGSNRPKKTP